MFMGTVTNNLDAKGRVSVPADFRAYVGDGTFDGIVLWPNRDKGCLEGGGMALMQDYQRMLDALDPYDPDREDIERMIFGESRRLNFDTNGRVTLPRDLADEAGLTDKVVFMGLGRRFEVWSPDRHAESGKALNGKSAKARAKLRTFRGGGAS